MTEHPSETPQPTDRRARRREWLVLVSILLAGLVLRVLYLRENRAKPEFTVPAIDAGFHDYWARGLAFGEWTPPHDNPDPRIRETPYLRPPGYPYFLSFVYRLAGPGYLSPRIVQMVLGLFGAALGFWFARRWYGPGAALTLAACTSVYWIFIYFEGELHAPALLICLLWSVVCVLGIWGDRPKFLRAVAAGLLLGLAALVRPNVLLFVPAVIGWMYWVARRRHDRRCLTPSLPALVLGVAAAIAPATVRNYLVARDFVLISSNAGINLYLGNNESADGRVAQVIPGFGPFGTCYDYPALVRNLERKLGKELKASEVSAHFTREAIRFMDRHPDRFITLTVAKAIMFWAPKEIPHNKMVNCERADSGVLRRIPGNFAAVLGMFVVGVLRLYREGAVRRAEAAGAIRSGPEQKRWEMSVLVLLLIVAYFLSILPFFMAARYRAAIIPFLLLVGAVGLVDVLRDMRSKGARRAGVLVAGWIALCALLGRTPAPHPVDQAKWHADRGAAHFFRGQMDDAIEEYRTTLALNPGFVEAHHNLSMALVRQEKLDEAVEESRRFVEASPEDTTGYKFLAELLVRTEHYEQAKAAFEQGLAAPRIDPNLMARAASFLATCPREDLRDVPEALRLAQEACRLTDNDRPELLAVLADVYAADGRIDRAIQTMKLALGLARARQQSDLIVELEEKLTVYRSGFPAD